MNVIKLCSSKTIDVGERDWKRKWASENIRASLSCLLFLPQMTSLHNYSIYDCISGERRGKETQSTVHWYMVIVRRMCRASGIGYLFHSRYKIIRGCEIVNVFVTVRGFSFAANLIK